MDLRESPCATQKEKMEISLGLTPIFITFIFLDMSNKTIILITTSNLICVLHHLHYLIL